MKFDRVYHLSHIDLDGYGSQVVTSKYFDNIEYFNSNYGDEIEEKLDNIFFLINSNEQHNIYIIVSDLNLTLKQCKFVEESILNSEKNINIVLLDHHISGQECAKKYDWYHLDDTRCATKIVYDYFTSHICPKEELGEFVDVVNAVDIWLKDDKYFEIGKVFMKIVDNANELNRIQFETQHRNYIFDMLSLSIPYINLNNSHIKLDEDIYHIKKRFFMQSDKNDTIDNLIAKYNVSLLKEKKEQYTIHYKEHKGILTYAVKNSSILGNEFLVQNPDYDFFLNINGKKTVSLRASGNIDVSLLAKDIFDGGGHKNASGGRFRELKDSFIYQNIRDQVQEKLSQ